MIDTVLTPPATNANQALWEMGDFTVIAAFMRESGETLVNALDLNPPLFALDLGCGDGTTALPLARRGATVLGVDISRNLVAAGRRRAEEAALTSRLSFAQGDASRLGGLESHTFDLTLSVFGAMFAPNPPEVAREMVRVTKPGGRIVMANWIPNDAQSFVSQLLRISAHYAPAPPAGFISPMLWGDPQHVMQRFVAAGIDPQRLSFEREIFTFRCPGGPEEFVSAFRRFYGPTMNAYAAAENHGRSDALHREVVTLADHHAVRIAGGIAVPATYLRVTVQC
jgi:ubiquinone/menaquinone biosynthesis C-methylase UbiE